MNAARVPIRRGTACRLGLRVPLKLSFKLTPEQEREFVAAFELMLANDEIFKHAGRWLP